MKNFDKIFHFTKNMSLHENINGSVPDLFYLMYFHLFSIDVRHFSNNIFIVMFIWLYNQLFFQFEDSKNYDFQTVILNIQKLSI